jgi:hypothetical protein
LLVAGSVNDDWDIGIHFFYARGEHREECTDVNLGGACGGNGPLASGADAMTDTATVDQTSYLWSVDLGVRAELESVTPELWIDFSQFNYHSARGAQYTDANMADASWQADLDGTRFQVGARAFYELNDNFTLIPLVEFTSVSTEIETSVSDPDGLITTLCSPCTPEELESLTNDSFEVDHTGFVVGSGIEYSADKILVVGSATAYWQETEASFNSNDEGFFGGSGVNETEEVTVTDVLLPVVALGVEYAWKPMVTFRGGIESTTIFNSHTSEGTLDFDTGNDPNPDHTEKAKDSFQATTGDIGLGLHFGNLTLDGTFGGLVIGGASSYFSDVSFVYNFQ